MGFLWLSDETAEDFFRRVRLLDYSDDLQLRNDYRSRGSWEMRLFDAWGHCYLGAEAANDLGDAAAWTLGGGHEVFKEGVSWVTLNLLAHDSFRQDTYNQAVGRSIGVANPNGAYDDLCFDAMVAGRLDLTLAGVPRGTGLSTRSVAVHDRRPAVRRVQEWRQSGAAIG